MRAVVFALALVGCARQEAPPEAGVTIEYIAHASFKITSSGGHSVLIDPFASQVWIGYDWPAGVEADAILITHPHYDHDGGEYRGMPVPWSDGARVMRESGRHEIGDITVEGIEGRAIRIGGISSPVLSGNSSCGNGENLSVGENATPQDDGTNEFCEDTPAE